MTGRRGRVAGRALTRGISIVIVGLRFDLPAQGDCQVVEEVAEHPARLIADAFVGDFHHEGVVDRPRETGPHGAEVLCRVIFSVPRDESADLAQEVEEPDHPGEHAPEPEDEPAAEPPMPRPAIHKVSEPRSTAKSRRRTDHSSAVPADRVTEVNEAIDRLLADGLSRQSIADGTDAGVGD